MNRNTAETKKAEIVRNIKTLITLNRLDVLTTSTDPALKKDLDWNTSYAWKKIFDNLDYLVSTAGDVSQGETAVEPTVKPLMGKLYQCVICKGYIDKPTTVAPATEYEHEEDDICEDCAMSQDFQGEIL